MFFLWGGVWTLFPAQLSVSSIVRVKGLELQKSEHKKNPALRSLDWKRLDMGWGFNVSFLISRAFWWPGWPAGWICIFLVGAPGPIVGSVSSMLRLVWLICLIGWKPLQRQVEQFFNMLGNLHVFCTWKKGVSCRTTLPRELPFAPIEEVCLQRVHSVGRMDISWFFWRRPGSFWAQSCGGKTCGTASERENFWWFFESNCGLCLTSLMSGKVQKFSRIQLSSGWMDGWGEMAAMFGRFSKRGWETEALGVVEMGAEWVVSSVDRNMKDVATKSYPQTWLIFKDLHNTACCFCQGPHTNSPSFPCPGSTLLNPLVWQSWWTQVTTVVSDMKGWLIVGET